MKKINLLYVFWILALLIFIWIMRNLNTQGSRTIFGIAITESYSLNVEYATIVNERRVQSGDRVKKGDTLLILHRSEMDRDLEDRLASINLLEVERDSKNELLNKEIAIFTASQDGRESEILAQIKIVSQELQIQKNLLQSIGDNKQNKENNVKQLELDALKESEKQLQLKTKQQLRAFESQRAANNNSCAAHIAQLKNDLNYFSQEQHKMFVLSPCDGIVEAVLVLPNDIAPQYKELVRVNSITPNKVTGFIHESVATPFKLGDTVVLASAARPDLKSKGIIIGNGNNLVELPLRLRKFVEIKAWGREVYIKIDPANNFYIGEKILVQMN